MGIPDHLTCLLRNLYAGQEATVGTLYGTTDWFKIKKGVQQGCLLSPCLFNLYAEHIMRNAELNELRARIKTGGRNIKTLRYADDSTLIAESEEELKSLLMRVREESERADLRLFKTLRSWHPASLVKVKSLSCVQLFATPLTVAYRAPPSMGFFGQKYWSGLPFHRGEKVEGVTEFLFLGSRITADGDCNYEIRK